jgi:asparaginyl-tRNA synthetase
MRLAHTSDTTLAPAEDRAGTVPGTPPAVWRRRADRHLVVPRSAWYRLIVELHDLITVGTVEFWHRRGAKAMQLPVTTGAVSSPMGLGSDSQPVGVTIDGHETYLADSMQFLLEYGLRLSPEGCYYLMPSFRGESPDATHLSQFVHSEAELPCDLAGVQRSVESYLRFLVKRMLEEAGAELASVVADLSHLERMADHDGPFASVTFDEADGILGGDEQFVTRHASWRDHPGRRTRADATGRRIRLRPGALLERR